MRWFVTLSHNTYLDAEETNIILMNMHFKSVLVSVKNIYVFIISGK